MIFKKNEDFLDDNVTAQVLLARQWLVGQDRVFKKLENELVEKIHHQMSEATKVFARYLVDPHSSGKNNDDFTAEQKKQIEKIVRIIETKLVIPENNKKAYAESIASHLMGSIRFSASTSATEKALLVAQEQLHLAQDSFGSSLKTVKTLNSGVNEKFRKESDNFSHLLSAIILYKDKTFKFADIKVCLENARVLENARLSPEHLRPKEGSDDNVTIDPDTGKVSIRRPSERYIEKRGKDTKESDLHLVDERFSFIRGKNLHFTKEEMYAFETYTQNKEIGHLAYHEVSSSLYKIFTEMVEKKIEEEGSEKFPESQAEVKEKIFHLTNLVGRNVIDGFSGNLRGLSVGGKALKVQMEHMESNAKAAFDRHIYSGEGSLVFEDIIEMLDEAKIARQKVKEAVVTEPLNIHESVFSGTTETKVETKKAEKETLKKEVVADSPKPVNEQKVEAAKPVSVQNEDVIKTMLEEPVEISTSSLKSTSLSTEELSKDKIDTENILKDDKIWARYMDAMERICRWGNEQVIDMLMPDLKAGMKQMLGIEIGEGKIEPDELNNTLGKFDKWWGNVANKNSQIDLKNPSVGMIPTKKDDKIASEEEMNPDGLFPDAFLAEAEKGSVGSENLDEIGPPPDAFGFPSGRH